MDPAVGIDDAVARIGAHPGRAGMVEAPGVEARPDVGILLHGDLHPAEAETPQFLHFIAGMQKHLPAAIALLAPYVNSYRRYVPDFAAPINLEWGRDNRTTGLRVPISSPEARRVENRLAGMDCNPYLGIAASLACGYLGLVEGENPRGECLGDAYMSSQDELPYNLGDALDMMAENTPMRGVLGEDFTAVYESVKRNEYKEFLQVISPWEREHLLLNV